MEKSRLSLLIEKNPAVKRDLQTLQEALSSIRCLREAGAKSKVYDLASPFERRRSAEALRITVHSST